MGKSDVLTNEHKQLALEAARQSIVLLKNENNLLPLEIDSMHAHTTGPDVFQIGVIGPLAADTQAMKGNYFGQAPFIYSVLDGLNYYVEQSNAQTRSNNNKENGGLFNIHQGM